MMGIIAVSVGWFWMADSDNGSVLHFSVSCASVADAVRLRGVLEAAGVRVRSQVRRYKGLSAYRQQRLRLLERDLKSRPCGVVGLHSYYKSCRRRRVVTRSFSTFYRDICTLVIQGRARVDALPGRYGESLVVGVA